MKTLRAEILPSSLPPLGINREQAAALLGIGASLFDRAVEKGTMPPPRVIGGRQIYDVSELIDAFKRLPHKGTTSDQLDDTYIAGNAFDDAEED